MAAAENLDRFEEFASLAAAAKLGGRVVAETLSRIWGPRRPKTSRTTVLLPTPEGPEMTTSFPGLAAIMEEA